MLFAKAIVLVVAMGAGIEPGAFRFDVDAPKGVAVTVKVDGAPVKPGVVYETGPVLGTVVKTFEVTWTEDGETKTASGTFTVTAGYVTHLVFSTPRNWAVARPGAD